MFASLLPSFASELLKLAATTEHLGYTVIHSRVFDDSFDHSILEGRNKDGLHYAHMLIDKHFHKKGPAATVDLLAVPGGAGRVWEVRMMHVRDDLRGKGVGKKIWDVIRDAHPNSEIAALPDPVKDKAVSKKDLYKVYESYGFEKPTGFLNKWVRTFGDEHPKSKKVKTAALSPTQAKEMVETHHGAEQKDWKAFEKNLKLKTFRTAVIGHPDSDAKLKRYTKNIGDYTSSKTVVGVVPSRTSSRLHKIKELPNGRFGCDCKDWRYSHSHRKSDCAHIQEFKGGMQ